MTETGIETTGESTGATHEGGEQTAAAITGYGADVAKETQDEHNEALGYHWLAMCEKPMDAALYLRLIYICNGQFAEATVLWDLVNFHRERSLTHYRSKSAADYLNIYGAEHCSERAYHRALLSLAGSGLIDIEPTVRNVTRRFKLNWPVLLRALSEVRNDLPGLAINLSTPLQGEGT